MYSILNQPFSLALFHISAVAYYFVGTRSTILTGFFIKKNCKITFCTFRNIFPTIVVYSLLVDDLLLST